MAFLLLNLQVFIVIKYSLALIKEEEEVVVEEVVEGEGEVEVVAKIEEEVVVVVEEVELGMKRYL